MDLPVITIVSGLPRSGTSMMMSMLEAGGIEALTDRIRQADEDNPGGYFEFEGVKNLSENTAWLAQARCRSVKVVSRLLYDLPAGYHYKVIFMSRDIDEVLASQRQMLLRRGQNEEGVEDEKLRGMFIRHLQDVGNWLGRQQHFETLYIRYDEVLAQLRKVEEGQQVPAPRASAASDA